MTSRELRTQRANIAGQMKALLAGAEKGNRELTGEEQASFDKMHADQEAIKAQIDRIEKVDALDVELGSRSERAFIPDTASVQGADAKVRADAINAFTAYIRYGLEGLTPEQRQIMRQSQGSDMHTTAQGVGSGGIGGYLVPQDFSNELERYLKTYGGVKGVARNLVTSMGNDIPWPSVDDTSNSGELLAENTTIGSDVGVTFSSVTLKAYKFSSKLVLVSRELLQDTYFNITGLLSGLLAERIGRIQNTYFTTGTGSTQPKGVVVEAGLGKTGASGQTTTIIYADLVDLEHSLDPAYRKNGALWMMADSTLKALKKLVDGYSRPLWLPGLAVKEPDTILGFPYVINQDVATMAASAKSLLFGDFSSYIVRSVLDVTLRRLDELWAGSDQVGFIAFARADGRAVNTSAIKYYINAAT